ncbi:MAG: glutamate racemase, partial [Clostridia bacterium]|nr:glutamate racemase [Clostridia bacterium]
PLACGMDALVLGCTHYPFVRGAISAAIGGLPIYDGNEGIARQTRRLLAESDLLQEAGQGGVTMLRRGQSPEFFGLARELIGAKEEKV